MTPSALLGSLPSPSTGVLHLGPLPLRAYGLCIALGVLAAVRIASKRYQASGGDPDLVPTIAWTAVPAGLVGSRLYHVATDWRTFQEKGWWHAIEIWKGGLGIWGGVALGTLVGCWVARRHKGPVLVLMDCAAPGIAVGQAIGRFGNWFNQELFGRPTTVPWALRIDLDHRPEGYDAFSTFHPTFLYESLWCLLVAGTVVLLGRRRALRPGQGFALYVALYTMGRTYFESLRIDTASQVGGLRINQLVAPAVGIVAAALFVWLGRRRPDPDPDEAAAAAALSAEEADAA